MSLVSVYIIAYNEAEKVRATIESAKWADEIILVDSWSTDGTAEIAQSMGAKVVQVKFSGFGDLRNRAIDACSHPWIFSLDADERCTPTVEAEIRAITIDPQALDAYWVPRRNFFMGRWIKHSGWYPNYRQPQLFRSGCMRYDSKPVHEGYILQSNKNNKYFRKADPCYRKSYRCRHKTYQCQSGIAAQVLRFKSCQLIDSDGAFHCGPF